MPYKAEACQGGLRLRGCPIRALARPGAMRDCYIVTGAGDAAFNGVYEVDTSRIGGKRQRDDMALCFRKVGGSACT